MNKGLSILSRESFTGIGSLVFFKLSMVLRGPFSVVHD